MIAQAFFYNAIFFTFALVLTDFFGIAVEPGRLVHPAVRGRQFPRAAAARPAVRHAGTPRHDYAHLWRFGRSARAFGLSVRDRRVERADPDHRLDGDFLFASPAASAAYLTVSETFPLEVRALAIALFYAVGTGIGGVAGPALFGALIDTGSRNSVFAGYLLGSGLMIAAAVIAWRYCIAAERRPLESVARPLAFVE